ncbi:MAG: Sua5/YciO/YrdC/YwlC family protein, partial [Chloroflexota bacterium]|nr:Sua5/YciO/YrdC/YwlC family protein [Chloroflexota bacterium]
MARLSKHLLEQIERGIAILREGGLVAFPTDTVYGLGARADNQWAVARVYRAKQRPINMAVPLLVANAAQASEVAREMPPVAKLLAEKFWPGALTLVLFKS